MKTPFRLDDHPRRTTPFSAPPAGYFDQLPRQVMERVQPAPATAWSAPAWITALSRPMRTSLASVLVLGGFATSVLLSQQWMPTLADKTSATVSLAQVPRAEMVQYLLASEQSVTLPDLAELPGTSDQAVTSAFYQASSAEVQEMLDEQPTEDLYL